MSTNIQELINIHTDKTAHVVGHGPSLKKYLDILSSIDKSKNIILSLNDVDTLTNLLPDYWITTNPECSVENYHHRINKFENTVFIYSDVMDLTPHERVKELLNVKYYSFDNVHFKSEKNIFHVKGWRLGCQRGWIDCCSRIINGRLTIQELLQKISGYKYHYSTADTTIIPTLVFAIIFGCKTINLYGVDLDYKIGYVKEGVYNSDSFDYWMDRLKSDFYIINESAKLLGINIKYFGFNSELKGIFDNTLIPEKIYKSDCKNYD